jgi:hypothetical protein
MGSGGGVTVHWSLLGVEVAGLTLYHSLVPSDGGVWVPQLGAKRLDLSLSSQQTGAQLHRHVLVVYHLHLGTSFFTLEALNLSFLRWGRRWWTEFYNSTLLRWLQEVMACQAVLATSSLIDALKAGP